MPFLAPKLLIILLLACGVAVIDTYAATLTVTKVEDTNDGVCDGDCSLREAVVAAVSGDTVVFSPLFNTPQTITLTLGQININKNLTITGTGPTLVDISANLAGRVFFISGDLSVTMTGMNLRDGKVGTTVGDSRGGAIFVANGSGSLDLSNMEFTNNTAFYEPMPFGRGSAVYCFDCTLTLANLNVHHNLGLGSAIQTGGSAVVDIRDSMVNDNIGGGVMANTTVNIQNTSLTGNTLVGVNAANLTLMNSSITNNRAWCRRRECDY